MICGTFLESLISDIKRTVSQYCPDIQDRLIKELMSNTFKYTVKFSELYLSYCNHSYDIIIEVHEFLCLTYSKFQKLYNESTGVNVIDMGKCINIMNYPNWQSCFYNLTYVLCIESIKFSRISLSLIQLLSLIYLPYCCRVFITIPKSDPYYRNYSIKESIFSYLVFFFKRYSDILRCYYFMIILSSFLIENINRGKLVSGMTNLELITYVEYSCWLIKMSNDKILGFRNILNRIYLIKPSESMRRKVSSLSIKSLIHDNNLTMKIYMDSIILKQAKFLILVREFNKKIIYDAIDKCKSKGIHYIKIKKEIIGIDSLNVDDL